MDHLDVEVGGAACWPRIYKMEKGVGSKDCEILKKEHGVSGGRCDELKRALTNLCPQGVIDDGS